MEAFTVPTGHRVYRSGEGREVSGREGDQHSAGRQGREGGQRGREGGRGGRKVSGGGREGEGGEGREISG